jgi:hypothetical protein
MSAVSASDDHSHGRAPASTMAAASRLDLTVAFLLIRTITSTAIRNLDARHSVVPACHQISAVARFPADDDRPALLLLARFDRVAFSKEILW